MSPRGSEDSSGARDESPRRRDRRSSGEATATVARYAAARLDGWASDRAGRLGPERLAELADLGLFGLTIPAEDGGLGLSLVEATEVVAALAERDRAVATTVGLHAGLGTAALVEFGSPAQRARYLPDLASGRRIAAFSATEPGAGSDLRRVSTRVSPGASGATLTGAKCYVTNGGLAGLFTVLAKNEAGGLELVLVERGDPGLTVGAEEEKLGLRASSTTSLFFDAVPLGPERRFAGRGEDLLEPVLARGRTLLAGGCVGSARAALRLAARHAQDRRQFGRPLAEQPTVRAQLAELAARLEGARALVEQASVAPPAERALWSMAAKVVASETAFLAADRAVQLFGGAGTIEGRGPALLLRDTRVTRIFEGANDVLLQRLGAGLVEDRSWRAWDEFASLAGAVDRAIGELGVRLFARGAELHRLGRAATVAATARAVRLADAPAVVRSHLEALLARDLAHALEPTLPSDELADEVLRAAEDPRTAP